ncbi:PREDICTED: uncharacterized protein LOC108661159 [Theobroma cacao]|uniref:Uncharacterized protein LOC108661159 n=1 Tax=Theobroma cacao TaxID=3641 RepID=A0AB32W242_THECC|nr:PREDICTED: uncharacterized protein LOC108661159 [Theobroma cacao]
MDQIKEAQSKDKFVAKALEDPQGRKGKMFTKGTDGVMKYGTRLYVPNSDGLRREILKEPHIVAYVVHLGATKMYQDLKEVYWWERLKKDVAEFISKCLVLGKLQEALGTELDFSTAFDSQTDGQSERTIQTLEDMLRACVIDLGVRSPIGWLKVRERKLLGPELVQDATEKIRMIRQRMLTAQSRQNSYADNRRKDLEFQVGDHVFLKVSLTKGIMRKYKPDPSHVIRYETIQLNNDLTFEKQPVAILDRQVRSSVRKM